MKRKVVYILISVVVVVFIVAFLLNTDSPNNTDILVPVRKEYFEVTVMTTGELEAKNAVKINAPDELRTAGILFKIKIADLVPEGTKVKKGDYVATLEKTDVIEKVRTSDVEIQKLQNQLTQSILDTSISLRLEREEVANRLYNLREKKNYLQGLKYEAAAEIKQAELEVEKAERSYQRAKDNYLLKKRQASTKIYEVASLLDEAKRKQDNVQDLLVNFVIAAPDNGMVIYARDWKGEKKTIGSQVDAFDPVVATLPDLNVMISRTFVNEIDISRVELGQNVMVGVDAFPNKKLKGKVIKIANIGEVKEGFEGKVFEVLIEVTQRDKLIRPTMTTSNKIICYEAKNTLTVPLEALQVTEQDEAFVFVKSGSKVLKKEIKIGKTNEMYAQVLKGLTPEDKVFLSVPKSATNKKMIRLDASQP